MVNLENLVISSIYIWHQAGNYVMPLPLVSLNVGISKDPVSLPISGFFSGTGSTSLTEVAKITHNSITKFILSVCDIANIWVIQ